MKLIEYLKLVPEGIKNYDKVIEGVKNDKRFTKGLLSEEEASEIIRRRIICESCPFLSTNAIAAGVYKSDRDDEHCIMCGCNKDFKTACLTCNCGIEAHNKNNDDNLELKWKSFYEKD